MGFFDLKAICGVCNEEVGLNRFKIKKSNAWLCPSCLKQAGGAMVINVNKITVEEIQAIIQEKESKLGDDPMSRAENMYNYCKENKFGSGFNEKWGIKHFKVLQDNLFRGEKVLMTFIGLHNYISTTKHDSNYAYAITNKRIIFGQKSLTGEKFKAVNHERINDITFNKGIIFGVLTIDTPQEKFTIALDSASGSCPAHIPAPQSGSSGASATGAIRSRMCLWHEPCVSSCSQRGSYEHAQQVAAHHTCLIVTDDLAPQVTIHHK